jgi:hypothetical protein
MINLRAFLNRLNIPDIVVPIYFTKPAISPTKPDVDKICTCCCGKKAINLRI